MQVHPNACKCIQMQPSGLSPVYRRDPLRARVLSLTLAFVFVFVFVFVFLLFGMPTHADASERMRTHPNACRRIRTHADASGI